MPLKKVFFLKQSVNYYSAGAVGEMLQNNRTAFREKGVSGSYENYFPTPTPLHI